jgi:RNA polymerase sigma factor (sigma-70 family)
MSLEIEQPTFVSLFMSDLDHKAIFAFLEGYRSSASRSDQNGFAVKIYDALKDFMRGYIYGKTGSVSVVEDVLQEAMAAIVNGLDTCTAKSAKVFRGWYYGIVKNKTYDYVRKKMSSRINFVPPEDIWQVLDASLASDVSRSAKIRMDLEVILSLLDKIKPRCRALLWHREGLGLEWIEVGEELNLNSDAARVKFARCMKVVRRIALGLK